MRRRSVNSVIARIVPPGPITLDSVIARAAAEVGVPLRIIPAVKRGTNLSGLSMLATTPEGQVGLIFVPAEASPEYQLHVAGHELWHLIEGHRCSAGREDHPDDGRWERWRSQRREAACDRFAARLGLEVQLRERHQRHTLPPAALMLDEAFGLAPVG